MVALNDQVIVWRLIVDLVAPGFRDRVVVESEDPLELLPEVIEVGGVAYERYPGAEHGEYVEFRQDHVVVRRLVAVRPVAPARADEDETYTIERRKNDEA